MNQSNRSRFEASLAGARVDPPVYAVYDWFAENRPQVDWARLFQLGLGRINHATLTRHVRPHVKIGETTSVQSAGPARRDVTWITDIGELHEWYLGEWRQEYLIKTPADYRIMARALADVAVQPAADVFQQSEAAVGDNGITLGLPTMHRTAFQMLVVDYVGLEQFSLAVASGVPELVDLLELMNELTYRDFIAVTQTPARHLKLWENISIEAIGPVLYRRHFVPVYERILTILQSSGQQLHVHYDGKLRSIAEVVARLPFGGIDSFTETPEGDLSVAEARAAWPDKYLWLHPNLGWYRLPSPELCANIRRIQQGAGLTRYCLMISEDLPPAWEQTVPLVLETLNEQKTAHS